MKKTNLLIIDSDASIGQTVSKNLGGNAYTVVALAGEAAALAHLASHSLPDMALVSASLSGGSGIACAKAIKAIADIPIIFLADAADLKAIGAAIGMYAEDFIVKPLAYAELDLRIQIALARMPSFDNAGEPLLQVDERLSIDFAHNRALVAGRSIGLTPIEAALLRILARNAPRVVQNETLLARVWPSANAFEDTLRVHMHRLRRKLEADPRHPHYIRTERGVGYRFSLEPPRGD